jgi:alanine dehydrogenase
MTKVANDDNAKRLRGSFDRRGRVYDHEGNVDASAIADLLIADGLSRRYVPEFRGRLSADPGSSQRFASVGVLKRSPAMKLRVLSEADCRTLLGMRDAIDVQAEAFALLAGGHSVEGLRSLATSENPPGVAIFNPSFLRAAGGYGIKVISDFYENERRGLTRMTGIVALFDGTTGYPRTVMEAGYLTDLRTGAGTGLAARYLARKNSRIVTIIGAGRVARNQLEALAELFDIEVVHVATRSRTRGEEFVRRMRETCGRRIGEIHLTDAVDAAVRSSDIVVAATTSENPVVFGAWLKPGTFVASAGAYKPTTREVDSETIRRCSNLVIDSRTDCLDHAGDFMIPVAEGVIARDTIAEIAELVSGARAPRRSDEELTYYKSIGVPIQDLVTARHMARRAVQLGVGIEIEIGGDND